jgi:LPS export ABC transporter protein LptC
VDAAPLPKGQVRLTGVVMDRFERDHLQTRARVTRMTLGRAAGVAEGEEVAVEARPREEGAPPTHLTAPRGRVELGPRTTVLSGGVRAVDGAGRVLTTETVTHEGAQGVLRATTPVTLEGANFRIQGAGFELRLDADDLQISGPIEAEVRPEGAPAGG